MKLSFTYLYSLHSIYIYKTMKIPSFLVFFFFHSLRLLPPISITFSSWQDFHQPISFSNTSRFLTIPNFLLPLHCLHRHFLPFYPPPKIRNLLPTTKVLPFLAVSNQAPSSTSSASGYRHNPNLHPFLFLLHNHHRFPDGDLIIIPLLQFFLGANEFLVLIYLFRLNSEIPSRVCFIPRLDERRGGTGLCLWANGPWVKSEEMGNLIREYDYEIWCGILCCCWWWDFWVVWDSFLCLAMVIPLVIFCFYFLLMWVVINSWTVKRFLCIFWESFIVELSLFGGVDF